MYSLRFFHAVALIVCTMTALTTAQMQNLTVTWKQDAQAGDIPAYVYYPETNSHEGAHPIALLFHPGGFVLGTAKMVPQTEISYFVSKGFVVVVPEYRLCPQVSLIEGPIQDAKDVLKWSQDELPALMKKNSIEVDSSKIISMGYSAGGQLALQTGLTDKPPAAIVSFYGVVHLSDESYTKPLANFSQIPIPSDDFLNKTFDGPVAITSPPMFIDGKPALSVPRCAWFIKQIKEGKTISSIVPEAEMDCADAVKHFKKGFPPTYFLQGKPDIFVDYHLAERSHKHLEKLGVESELVLGEFDHVFDLALNSTDPLFTKYVVPALDWAVAHV